MTSSKDKVKNWANRKDKLKNYDTNLKNNREKYAGMTGHFATMNVTSSSGIHNMWRIAVGWETSNSGTAKALNCLSSRRPQVSWPF